MNFFKRLDRSFAEYLSRSICSSHAGTIGKYHKASKIPTADHYRYMVKDKSSWTPLTDLTGKFPKAQMENKYVMQKADIAKRRCFEKIQDMKRQFFFFRRINSMPPQRTYDPQKPILWMKVKDMYATNRVLIDQLQRQQ